MPQADTDTVERPMTAGAAQADTPRPGTAVAIREPDMKWLDVPREELVPTLQASLFPAAKPESIEAVLDYCAAAGLNVMLKPVHIVPMNVKVGANKWEWRDVVMPGINHYRTQASRSGVYAGKSEPEFGDPVTENLGGLAVTFPAWCRVTVYKIVAGLRVAFTATEFWLENYATKGKDTKAPNAMWSKRPYGQIAKCAEAQALRMAFPELVGGETAEEMEGKVIDLEAVEVLDHKPAASRSLDSFAGQDGGDTGTGGATEPADIGEGGADQGTGALTDESPVMPDDAAKAWAEKQDWKPGWKWLNQVMPGLTFEARQALGEEHGLLLWAVYESDLTGTEKKPGPGKQSQAAVKFTEDHKITLPTKEALQEKTVAGDKD